VDLRDPGAVAVAAARTPNVTCNNCGHRLSWKKIKEMVKDYGTRCTWCDTFLDCFSANIEVRADNAYLLYETPRYWWHVTERDDWLKNVTLLGMFVHVGTPQTVRTYHDIIVQNADWKTVLDAIPFVSPRLHLYRVELAKDAVVDPQIAIDSNYWPHLLGDDDENHAYKYVNSVEVPGSISLLVPYKDLTNITEVITFTTRPINKEA